MGLFITLGIIILIVILIVFMRVSLVFISNDGFSAKLRISLFTFTLYDDRSEKPIRKHKYLTKALEGERKKIVAELSRARSGEANGHKSALKDLAKDAETSLSLFSGLFENLVFPAMRNARVRFKYFNLTVASKDPADTALIYGALCPSVSYLLSVISQNAKISDRQLKKVKLECNFLEEKTKLTIHATVSISLWKLVLLMARSEATSLASQTYGSSKNETELTVTK